MAFLEKFQTITKLQQFENWQDRRIPRMSCLSVSNVRKSSKTDQAQFFCGSSHDTRKKIILKRANLNSQIRKHLRTILKMVNIS